MKACHYFARYLRRVLPGYLYDVRLTDLHDISGKYIDSILVSKDQFSHLRCLYFCRVNFGFEGICLKHYDNVYYLADPVFDLDDLVCDIIGCALYSEDLMNQDPFSRILVVY